MGGDKDMFQHERDHLIPLVTPLSKFDELMYKELVQLNKRVKIITEILEVNNEKSNTDDSNSSAYRL